MYTYDPNANKKNIDNENLNSLNEEDLFLDGGFDSFSESNNNMNVGTPYMANVDQYGVSPEAVNRWKPTRILNFWEQLAVSFVPTRYDQLNGMTIKGVKQFLRKLTVLIILGTYLTIILNALIYGAWQTGTTTYTLKDIFSPFFFTVILIVYGVMMLIYPFIIRFEAWFFRWIARLIKLIYGKELKKESLYSVSIYSIIPTLFISLIFNLAPVSQTYMMLDLINMAIGLLLPIIYMIIAIPRMD